jgi:hypothetical protein
MTDEGTDGWRSECVKEGWRRTCPALWVEGMGKLKKRTVKGVATQSSKADADKKGQNPGTSTGARTFKRKI